MELNWITIAAQVVNFLILVWLLRRFLFEPVTRAMERREQRIADGLAEARALKRAAAAEGRAYREQQAALESQSQEILEQTRRKAEEQRRELLRAARADAEARRREWLAQVEAQQREFLERLRRDAGERFFALARRLLRDMADADLETRMITVFARHLAELDVQERATLAAAAAQAGRVTVETCFAPAAEDRAELTRAIRAAVGAQMAVGYTRDPQRPFGIELRAGSQVVLWTFDDYLNQLEDAVNELLARRPTAGAA